jgi:di/tricarboxylate transporter
METQAVLTLVILTATLLVLLTRRLRPDLTALAAMLALILTGVLTPEEAFAAFGQPVIIIIPCIYVLGAALYETGVATLIANRLVRLSHRGTAVLLFFVMLVAGLMSAVLSSLLVAVVMMPAVLRVSRQARLAPARLLLPLVVGATMGNLLSLIGTVSNLIVADLVVAAGHAPLDFLSLTPYGLVSLGLAVGWHLVAGRRLLRREAPAEPEHPSLERVETDYHLHERLYRLRVRAASDLLGHRLDQVALGEQFRLNVLAVRPPRGPYEPAGTDRPLEQDDVLVVEGARGDILQAAGRHTLEPKGAMDLEAFNRLEEETLRLAELMVPFRSRLVGANLAEVHFRERYGLNVLAVQRRGRAIRTGLPELRLLSGDTLLVQGPAANLQRLGRDFDLVLVTELGPRPGDLITAKVRLTLAILAAMILAVVTGLLPLAPASLAAAVALILTGCIPVHRAYRSIEGSVIVLIGGMLPLATALEKTGAAEAIAGQIAGLDLGLGPLGSLLLLYLFAAGLTQVISNSAAAALLTPIALRLAVSLDQSPQTFAIAMAVAVTTSYATPLVNTDNLLVREAGDYTARDYLANGLPLFALQTVAMMLLFWLL